MSSEQQITVTMWTTKVGWDHIIQLLRADTNTAWSEFNKGTIKVIQTQIDKYTNQQPSQPAPMTVQHRPTAEDEGYFLGPDEKYHDPEWFGEEYGGYANYRMLEDEASDFGFPDADSYQQWLDDD